jgi:hypothetical protein
MAQRKQKRFWNEGGYDGDPHPERLPKPPTEGGSLGHSTTAHFAEQRWECGRCEQIRAGIEVTVPDHHPSCAFRDSGKDPSPKAD